MILSKSNLFKPTSLIIILLFLLTVPFWAGNYMIHAAIMTFLMVIYSATWRQLFAAGEFSFGHNAWIGVGAYAASLLSLKMGLSFWLALPIAGIVAIVGALIFGYATLKVRGIYWAILTWAFGEVLVAVYTNFSSPFGGAGGLSSIPRPYVPFFPEAGESKIFWYFLGLAMVLIILVALYALEKSRFGRNLVLICEAENLARSLGIDVLRYKVINFTIASFFAAIAGAFYAYYVTAISPLVFNVMLCFLIVIYVAVGGRGNYAGPIIGATLLTMGTQALIGAGFYRTMILGVILIAFQLFLPTGLTGLPQLIKIWLQRRRLKGVADESSA